MAKRKIVVNAALTGAQSPKDKNPYIPTTPEEIAEDAYKVWKAGAAVVHLHMRDENANPTMDPKFFRKTIDLIRAHEDCDVIINCTSSGSIVPIPDEARMIHFNTMPEIEIGSCDIGSMNWTDSHVFDNNPAFLHKLCQCYIDNDIVPEIEIFDMGMMTSVYHYRKIGLLPRQLWAQFVLGVNPGGSPAEVDQLMNLVNHKPADMKWSAFGIGKDHLKILYASLALGCDGVRVGLEDNIWYSKGELATNLSLVERAVRVVKEFDCEPATPAEAREILGIKPLVR